MVFSSVIFISVFLPGTLAVYFILGKQQLKNVWLLLVSLLFYAWGEPRNVFLLLLSITVSYFSAYYISKNHDIREAPCKVVLALTIVFDVVLLFAFKYIDFTINNLNILFGLDIQQTNIALPIGISFFTFQAMSYVVDVYRKDAKAQKNPINVALYIALFPQLVAGPIVRYTTIEEELQNRKTTVELFAQGVSRFALGLGKKALLANQFALFADNAFEAAGTPQLTCTVAWIGAIAYTLQIYFDFSGYSDMAIGLGKMFGFHFPENFNYPYISKSATEFWRRWHISLSSWFRDYVYIPLGGSRRSSARNKINLFAVWMLTGLWHGANWTFVGWGLMYCIVLVIEKQLGLNKNENRVVQEIYRIPFLLIVICGWVMFRSDSISEAGTYIATMFTTFDVYPTDIVQLSFCAPVLIMGMVLSTPVVPKLNQLIEKACTNVPAVLYGVRFACIALLLTFSIICVISSTYNPFIYFNF